MVYVSPDVNHTLLSQIAGKGLGLVGKEFPNVREPAEPAKCTSLESEDDEGRAVRRPQGQAVRHPQAQASGRALGEAGEGGARQRCNVMD